MGDPDWVHKDDDCQVDPSFCDKGLSFSIWEKLSYDDNPLIDWEVGNEFKPRQYIISTGAEYFPGNGTAYPGYSIYHQGTDLVAIVSTGEKVWRASASGLFYNNSWANVGIRWRDVDENDPLAQTNPVKLGGLELFVNADLVAQTVLPEYTDVGSRTYVQVENYTIMGRAPPVMMLGCGYDYGAGKYTDFGNGEYDELAGWSKPLVTNADIDETIFFLGGFGNALQIKLLPINYASYTMQSSFFRTVVTVPHLFLSCPQTPSTRTWTRTSTRRCWATWTSGTPTPSWMDRRCWIGWCWASR